MVRRLSHDDFLATLVPIAGVAGRTGATRIHEAAAEEAETEEPLTVARGSIGFCGADDGIRTRDPHLGKVMLYQLSHVRVGSTP